MSNKPDPAHPGADLRPIDGWPLGLANSPFAQRAAIANPRLASQVSAGLDRQVGSAEISQIWANYVPSGGQVTDLSTALRQWRNHVVWLLACRSATGAANLEEVGAAMTALAQQAVTIAMDWVHEQMRSQFGVAQDAQGRAQKLIVVGMGKLGGNELNVSSDIDLVMLFRSPGQSSGDSIGQGKLDSGDYFARLIRQVTPLLQDTSAHGFVFRVDLRLRPHGDSGPPAVSLHYLEDYLLSEGRAWERFAWSKARVIYGADAADITALQQIINPFVYRRYLDFSAVTAISDLHQKIQRDQFAQTQRRDGFDIKLGRGGIRQIEFLIQLIQLMRAGKDPSLRQPNSLLAIAQLERAGLLTKPDAQTLGEGLRLLREVEHALQWYDDQQTHWFEMAANAKSRFIESMLRIEWAVLIERLQQTREQIAILFARALGDGAPDKSPLAISPQVQETPLPFAHLDRFARQSETNQKLIKKLWISGLSMLEDKSPPLQTRWERFLETLMGRSGYLVVLEQSNVAMTRLIKLLAHNPWAAQFLTRYPVVIDDLLTSDWLEPPTWSQVAARLHEQLEHCLLAGSDQPDVERQIDALRELHHAYTLRLLAQEIEGVLTVQALADHLSALADLLIDAALRCIAPNLSGLAVIAYGKLGAKELGFASDLDLVFLYDDQAGTEAEKYSTIVRKLTHWLTVQTGAGSLYEVDLRLRPDGDSGLVVSSLAGFTQYQEKSAWVWEHQALSRARFCAGDAKLGAAFEQLRLRILGRTRDPNATKATVLSMREKIHLGHVNRTSDFDLKHDSGGMVDIEFIVQTLVLLHGHQQPAMLANRGNIELLRTAATLGLIDAALAKQVGQIYRRLRKAQYDWRLNSQDQVRLPPDGWRGDRSVVTQLWNSVFGIETSTKQSSQDRLPPQA
jgi:[glutamine synthetase] adenylyltransferase / [glutamine synthetase]-adenylyl-L-tyrosine phosphorylase